MLSKSLEKIIIVSIIYPISSHPHIPVGLPPVDLALRAVIFKNVNLFISRMCSTLLH